MPGAHELPRRKQRGIRYRITDFFDAASGGEFDPCWIKETIESFLLYLIPFFAGERENVKGNGGKSRKKSVLQHRLSRSIKPLHLDQVAH